MKTINKFSLIATLGILTLSPLASSAIAADATSGTNPPATPDFSGTYNCSYHDPQANPMDGTETIAIKQNGDMFRVTHTANGNTTPYGFGIGIINKSISNAFTYIYWLPKTPAVTYLQYFFVKPDGSIDGVFAQSNKNKSGTEKCTKASS